MANPEHVKQLKQGVESWNRWRSENPETWPNLSRADLSGVNLSGANLSEVGLYRTNLSEVDLSEANLSRSSLKKVDLSEANLSGANLSGADLSRANLSGAVMWRTAIAKIDLRSIKGLTTVRHTGPSHIELFSVQLPQDGSALHFLRGAGVPDEWIDFWRMSMMQPIQYHSCFISYSSNDEMLATRLHADLQAQGVRCWFAPHDMKIGDVIRKVVDQAIHLQDKVLLLLSEAAIASGWVDYEVEIALAREREQQREILFPLRLDETVLQSTIGWAATLRRTRHIGDFTTWKDHDAYQQAFARLLHDLKQE